MKKFLMFAPLLLSACGGGGSSGGSTVDDAVSKYPVDTSASLLQVTNQAAYAAGFASVFSAANTQGDVLLLLLKRGTDANTYEIWSGDYNHTTKVWSAPAKIHEAVKASEIELGLDDNGIAHVMRAALNDDGIGDTVYAMSREDGHWGTEQTLSTKAIAPALAVSHGSMSHAAVSWETQSSHSIQYETFTPGNAGNGWPSLSPTTLDLTTAAEKAVPVTDAQGGSPSIAYDLSENLNFLYLYTRDSGNVREIRYSQVAAGGAQSNPQTLTSNPYSAAVLVNAGGNNLLAHWQEYTAPSLYLQQKSFDGSNWSDVTTVASSSNSFSQIRPQLNDSGLGGLAYLNLLSLSTTVQYFAAYPAVAGVAPLALGVGDQGVIATNASGESFMAWSGTDKTYLAYIKAGKLVGGNLVVTAVRSVQPAAYLTDTDSGVLVWGDGSSIYTAEFSKKP